MQPEYSHLFKANLASRGIFDKPGCALRTNRHALMRRVEDELGEGEVIRDVGKRAPWRDKFSHGGRREGEEVMSRPGRT
jgi:hypothetical protein